MKNLIAGLVVLVLLAGGAYVLVNHNKSNKSSTSTYSSNSTQTNTNSGKSQSSSNAANPSTGSSVTIDNFAFSPASLTVKKGTTVTWTNKDSTTHTVTENDGQSGPGSNPLEPGKTYSFTYNTVGTFKYHCSIHTDMTGSVTVTE